MLVALVTDALNGTPSGNRTTVERWLSQSTGLLVAVFPPDADQDLEPVPDVVHGYHALHGGVAARALARRYGRPLVISLGGTDLFALVSGDALGRTVSDVLLDASVITGAFDSFGEVLEEQLGPRIRYVTVPRGVIVPHAVKPKPPDGTLDVLLPSGLRPVKDPMLAVDLAARLVERGVPLRMRMLGAALDEEYTRRVRERAHGLDFVSFGELEPEEMGEAYARSDVVWNTALHEGGANVKLEAIAHGCALFLRDVPGNRDFLEQPNAPGRLFDPREVDAAEAFHKDLLLETPAQRQARALTGLNWLRRHYDAAAEARALKRAWSIAAGL